MAVLAGGLGSRMGAQKASLELGGRPLISYPLAAAAAAGLEVAVVGKETGASGEDAAVARIVEPAQPRHPLVGIVAALEHADGRAVLALPCDMPFLTGALLGWMAGLEGAVVPWLGERPQPFPARCPAESLPTLRRALHDGDPLAVALERLSPRTLGLQELARFGDPSRLLFNVNRPEDLRAAHELLAGAAQA